MGFAPKGLKVGEIYEDNGKKFRVTQVFDFGYNNVEVVEDIPKNELPFAPDEEPEEEEEEFDEEPGEIDEKLQKKRNLKKK